MDPEEVLCADVVQTHIAFQVRTSLALQTRHSVKVDLGQMMEARLTIVTISLHASHNLTLSIPWGSCSSGGSLYVSSNQFLNSINALGLSER